MGRATTSSLILALCASLVGCQSGKPDAARVARAVRAYRMAGEGQERTRLEDLRRAPCGDGRACTVKEACLSAADATVAGLELKRQVAAGLAELKAGRLAPGSARASEMPSDLDKAELLLRQGNERLATCDDLLVDLERKNGL